MAVTLPHEAMSELFDATLSNDLPSVPDYNVCPSLQVHTVKSVEGVRRIQPMRWGFIPSWYTKPNDGPLLINARSETISEKPAFRDACRNRRCLIVADGFYEWKREKGRTPLPWWVTRDDGAPMVFAGIWQDWERSDEVLSTCAIVTTSANEDMAPIHHRLPVILEEEHLALWLGEEGKGAATLMRSAPEGALSFVRVSTMVNSNKAQGSELVQPLEAHLPRSGGSNRIVPR